VTKNTPGAVRTVSKSKKWYGRYINSNGHTIRTPLSESKAKSKEDLDVLAGEARKERIGITDKYNQARCSAAQRALGRIRNCRNCSGGER